VRSPRPPSTHHGISTSQLTYRLTVDTTFNRSGYMSRTWDYLTRQFVFLPHEALQFRQELPKISVKPVIMTAAIPRPPLPAGWASQSGPTSERLRSRTFSIGSTIRLSPTLVADGRSSSAWPSGCERHLMHEPVTSSGVAEGSALSPSIRICCRRHENRFRCCRAQPKFSARWDWRNSSSA